MGKSFKGKELGKGISQRKNGLYQARFVNRFGKRRTIYGKTYTDISRKQSAEQFEDEKQSNVVKKDISLDEWYHIWLNTCKKNCKSSSKESYTTHYKRIKEDLGWRKSVSLNLINMQEAINKLNSDNERANSKKILVDMLNKALDSDLITKNVAKQINTVVTKGEKREKRVLTRDEVDKFLAMAEERVYYNLFVLALEQVCVLVNYVVCNGLMLILRIGRLTYSIHSVILVMMGNTCLRCMIPRSVMEKELFL